MLIKEFPPFITLPCYNKECSNQIHLRLDAGYYKNKAYDGECTRCGISLRIEKFSPFLENITNSETSFDVLAPKSKQITKPMKSGNL